jgi:hypothetical protein
MHQSLRAAAAADKYQLAQLFIKRSLEGFSLVLLLNALGDDGR